MRFSVIQSKIEGEELAAGGDIRYLDTCIKAGSVFAREGVGSK
jgi:hypothetical protein